jgi:hypothetical protein
MARSLILAAALALTACASPATVRVDVPVPVRAEAPAWLLAPIDGPDDLLQEPGTAGVVACLDRGHLRQLTDYVAALRVRDEQWRAWARPEQEIEP